jgi:large subunit ribosomal protein L11
MFLVEEARKLAKILVIGSLPHSGTVTASTHFRFRSFPSSNNLLVIVTLCITTRHYNSIKEAMAKKIANVIKLNLPAGSATPAPPVGPILGQAGINMMDFIKQYNDRTADRRGEIIPAEITVYEDRSFTFELKLPPVSAMIMKALKLKKGSATPSKEVLGTLTADQIRASAQEKMPDLNTNEIEKAIKVVAGTARSMGVTVA